MRFFAAALLAFLICSLAPVAAHAACGSPMGAKGDMLYNADKSVVQYCDGADWIGFPHASASPFDPADPCFAVNSPSPGDACGDGSVYAGTSPDGSVPMFAAAADFAGTDEWGSQGAARGGTTNTTGAANTTILLGFGAGTQPAAENCGGLTLDGHSDWYLPAKDELAILATNEAAIGGFVAPGAYPVGWYWSSTEATLNDACANQIGSGTSNCGISKGTNGLKTRCVRKGVYVPPPILDPCDPANTPAVGTTCNDGTVYAGTSGGNRLFVTANDNSAGISWNNGNNNASSTTTSATSTTDGAANTATIIAANSDSVIAGTQPHRAAQLCNDLAANDRTDWYLPAKDELNVLYTNKTAIGNFNTSGSWPGGYYWSSTEHDNLNAETQKFDDGTQIENYKHYAPPAVRCVRKGFKPGCANPSGAAGSIIYNGDSHVLQWCDGTKWNAAGPRGTGTVSCADLGSTRFTDPVSGHCYYRTASPRTWDTSKAICAMGGAYLADISSSAENTAITGNLGTGSWFGANDKSVEGTWRWDSGALAGQQFWSGSVGGSVVGGLYNNWATGSEPNDSGGNEDCGDFNGAVAWNDENCANQKTAICEMDSSSSCANPAGAEGDIIYNDAHDTMQYCNGAQWVAIGTEGVGSIAGGFAGTPADCSLLGDAYYNDPVSGHCYYRENTTVTYSAAKTACTADGAYLVQIGSALENKIIKNSVGAQGLWIGAGDSAVEGEWKWESTGGDLDGQQFWQGAVGGSVIGGLYSNWYASEPNDTGSDEDCGQFYADGSWNDSPCTSSMAYICEKSPSGGGGGGGGGGPYESCSAILDDGASTGDGVYTIDPQLDGNPISAYCDMTHDGGGWTMIAAQFEADPVTNWDEGIQGDYDPTLATSKGFALNTAELPPQTQIAFGKDLDPTFTDYAFFNYTTGNLALTGVDGIGSGNIFQIHRNTALFYNYHDPEDSTGNIADWNNTLTFDEIGGHAYTWAFSPENSVANSRGYALSGNVDGSGQSYAWTVWSRSTPPDCSSPNGQTGEIATVGGVLKYCDGSSWVAVGSPVYESCSDILDNAADHGDDLYVIDPQQDGNNISVYCDMTHDGGGWTLVAAQYEADPAPNWNEGIQSDYDPSLTKKRGFSLNTAELPPHTETAFGKGTDPTFIDYATFTYTTGDIAKTTLTGALTSNTFDIYRNSGLFYSAHDPEASTFNNPDWNNTLTFDETGGAAYTWAFSPQNPTLDNRGFGLGGSKEHSNEVYPWTVWVRNPPGGGGGGGGYAYNQAITFDHSKVVNTDQTNFPALVSLTDADLKSTGHGGNVESTNGYDIIFTSDSGGLTQLDHEIESYDATTGTINMWVKIPTLSHTTDTVIYMWYGNSGISTSQENTTGVWNANYKAVYHLRDGSTLSATDSTSNANNGTISAATATSGQVAGGGSFNGSSKYIQVPNTSITYPASSDSLTFQTWFKTSATSGVIFAVDDNVTPSSSPAGYVPALYVDSNGKLRATLFWHGSTNPPTSAANYDDNTWHLATLVYDNGTETLYVDGASVTTQSTSQTSFAGTYAYFYGTGFGTTWSNLASGWNYFNGSMDEMRISNSARSADWIATEYNNQSDPAAFISAAGGGGGGSYTNTRPITFDHNLVVGSDQTDFPALVSFTDADFKSTGNGGDVTSASGYDLIFTSDSGGTMQLDHEIESYDPVTGTINMWVRIPTLSHTVDTTIYIHYGDASITTSQENIPGVWNSNYKGVWHLPDGSTLSANDSTANAHNGSISSGSAGAGKIDGGASFAALGNGIDFGSSTDFTPGTGAFTMSGWLSINDTSTRVAIGRYNGSGNDLWIGSVSGAPVLSMNATSAISPTSISGAGLHYIVGTRSAGGTMSIYVDGVSVGTNTYATAVAPGGSFVIGNFGSFSSYPWNGDIDEARYSSTERSADWIATEYNNQSDAAAFISLSSGFAHYRAITIDHTKVPNTDQTNFPVLVSGTYADLKTTGNGGDVTSASGYDIVFTSDSGGATPLDFEIEKYNATTGAVSFWVNVPTLSHTVDTVIYMHYGNAAITTSQENKTGTWNSNFKGVWHMSETGATLNDTIGNNNLSTNSTAATGQIGGGQSFNGSSQLASKTSSVTAIPANNGNQTVSVWFTLEGTGGRTGICLLNGSSSIQFFRNGADNVGFTQWGGAYLSTNHAGPALSTWHNLVYTFDGTTHTTYYDGAPHSNSTTPAAQTGTPDKIYFSTWDGGSEYWHGSLDEIKISNSVRSADWIATEYNNQSDPSTFYAVGSEQ